MEGWRHYTFWVFSTYVEMIPVTTSINLSTFGVLHVCGDDPKTFINIFYIMWCSPRMWR